MRWWPRSIRSQMFVGLMWLEVLSLILFSLVLYRLERNDVLHRAKQRLLHQSASVAAQARESLFEHQLEGMGLAVRMMGAGPSVLRAKITDPYGNPIYVSSDSDPDAFQLVPEERAQIAQIHGDESRVFSFGEGRLEGVEPIYTGSTLHGYAWVESAPDWDNTQLRGMLSAVWIFGVIWIGSSALLVNLLARSIYRPLGVLQRGTRALMTLPESGGTFPLPVAADNEFGDLIRAFNSMVASIQEQRAGLNDTLALLDSMQANAPIGLAFFDRHLHFVRINQIFSDLTGIPLSRHLGRTPVELFPVHVSRKLEDTVEQVFETETPVAEIELSGVNPGNDEPWIWSVSAYPVLTAMHQVRWVGIIVRDMSERARAEETLRRTEKLAATGRLAASIAHEINNPLEAVTNLLFLLRQFCNLDDSALQYVAMAEHEVRRIAEIAQQTLRFYRQSTQPLRANIGDLIDSVLELYKGRLTTLSIQVERSYDPEATLFCFEGEIRQVLANLVGNAIDATSEGRLIVRTRRSRDWKNPEQEGVRITVADTGSGMSPEVRARIFEAFFTTKDATGTGLGLWVSLEIVEKHHGCVHVRSRAAQGFEPSGTVFQIFLPDNQNLENTGTEM